MSHPITPSPDVLLSVQGISRAASMPTRDLPRWVKRLLPKSGLAGKGANTQDFDDADNPDDEMLDTGWEENAALDEISFDLKGGEGLGVLGTGDARATLMRILIGALPPTTGHVVVRGRVAPLLVRDLTRYARQEVGQDAIHLVARFMHWPKALLRSRMGEIEEFARLEELDHLSTRKRERMETLRLLLSAALHLDASVYLLDQGIGDDPAFGLRCYDLVEQRKAEGAAIVQGAQRGIDDLTRLCDHVLWFDEGTVTHQGRPIEVAVSVHKARPQEVHPLALPMSVGLSDGGSTVEVGPDGTNAEFDIQVFRPHLDVSFAMEFHNELGKTIRIDQPGLTYSKDPGLYRLTVFIPPGLLEDGAYRAHLVAQLATGVDKVDTRELLRFDVVSEGQSGSEVDAEAAFVLLPAPDDEPSRTPAVAEWDVSRAAS
jgi:ABC-type polysaccharide/polyol phosphate transport system ATPase subunit